MKFIPAKGINGGRTVVQAVIFPMWLAAHVNKM